MPWMEGDLETYIQNNSDLPLIDRLYFVRIHIINGDVARSLHDVHNIQLKEIVSALHYCESSSPKAEGRMIVIHWIVHNLEPDVVHGDLRAVRFSMLHLAYVKS